MVDTYSTFFNLVKPADGGDSNSWGDLLNQNTDAIDAAMHSNAVAISNSVTTANALAITVAGKVAKAGDTMTGPLTTPQLAIDANYFMAISGSDPLLQFEANRFLFYDRSTHQLAYSAAGNNVLALSDVAAAFTVPVSIIPHVTGSVYFTLNNVAGTPTAKISSDNASPNFLRLSANTNGALPLSVDSAGNIYVPATAVVSGGVNITQALVVGGASQFTGNMLASTGSFSGALAAANGTVGKQVVNISQFAATASANGYQMLPSGAIIQWGNGTTSGGVVTVTFPIAFPTSCVNVQLTIAGGITFSGSLALIAGAVNTTSVVVWSPSGTTVGFYYVAFGY